MSADDQTMPGNAAGDIDQSREQPIEEAEKNLSRHSTKDSSPPVEEQWRTNVPEANEQLKNEKD